MADEEALSPTAAAVLFSAFGVVGIGLLIYVIELPIDVLNTLGGAFAVAVLLGAIEFFVVKKAIAPQDA